MSLKNLHTQTHKYLKQLVSHEGIVASLDFRFNHDFCRDTFKNARNIWEAHQIAPDIDIWEKTKKSVFRFWQFQREDGKLRHEIRKFDKEIFKCFNGFYYKVGNLMMNDDTVDGTPLALCVTPLFIETEEDFQYILPKAIKALDWMIENMDKHYGWLSYEPNPKGIIHQGWMDSKYGVLDELGNQPNEPVALVEAQAYAWKAFYQWSELLKKHLPKKSLDLKKRAVDLKNKFKKLFAIRNASGELDHLAHALHKDNKPISIISINQAFCLIFPHNNEFIIDLDDAYKLGLTLTSQDMFNPRYGVKTFQKNIGGDGYHLGNNEDVYWIFATHETARALINISKALRINGRKKESEECIKKAVEIMKTNLNIISKIGFREQFKAKEDSISFYGEGTRNQSCLVQTWTVTACWHAINHLLLN